MKCSNTRTVSSCRSIAAASGIATTTYFRDLLRNELEQSEPEIVTGLNKRAMTWCIDNAPPETAVYYGRAAGETSAVAGLLDALALPLYYDGRRETVEEWLGWFEE